MCEHVPRDFRYLELPDWAQGPLEEGACYRYDFWLARHLRSREFPMNEAQQQYANSLMGKSPEWVAIHLGDNLGWRTWDRERLEFHAREGHTYSELLKDEYELWLQCYDEDQRLEEPFETVRTAESEYNRIAREMRQEEELESEYFYADVFIRPLLAMAARQCESDEEATRVVTLFYETFNEAASK